MIKRLVICFFNIFFPPLAVLLLTGLNEDFFFNCILFLLAVIPSHIHGFYISLTYFNRKRKVRKGVYPSRPRHLIWSRKVNNGGASQRDIERMKQEKEYASVKNRASQRLSNRIHRWDDGNSEKYVESGGLSRRSTRRSRRYDDDYDYHGEPLSQRSSRRIY